MSQYWSCYGALFAFIATSVTETNAIFLNGSVVPKITFNQKKKKNSLFYNIYVVVCTFKYN